MLCLVLIVVCSLVVVSLFLPGSAGIFFHEEKMRGWAERPPVRRQYCTGTVVKHQRDIDWFSRKKRKIVKKNENKKKKNVFWDKIAIFNKSEVKTQEVRVNIYVVEVIQFHNDYEHLIHVRRSSLIRLLLVQTRFLEMTEKPAMLLLAAFHTHICMPNVY